MHANELRFIYDFDVMRDTARTALSLAEAKKWNISLSFIDNKLTFYENDLCTLTSKIILVIHVNKEDTCTIMTLKQKQEIIDRYIARITKYFEGE